MLNIGLVGLGNWGRKIVCTINQEISDVKIHRAVSSNREAQFIVGKQCVVHEDWTDLLECRDLDAVILAVPPELQYEIASSLLNVGVPLFIEKPMCLSVGDAEKLCSLGEKMGSIVSVDHIDLYNPALLQLLENFSSGHKINRIFGKLGGSYSTKQNISPLWEYGPHFVAVLIRFMRSFPERIEAFVKESEIHGLDRQLVSLKMYFKNFIEAELTVGNGLLKKTRLLRIFSPTGVCEFNDMNTNKLMMKTVNGEVTWPEYNRVDSPLCMALRSFLRLVSHKTPYLSDLKLGLDVVKVLATAELLLARNNKIN